jgi:hypothetical protein
MNKFLIYLQNIFRNLKILRIISRDEFPKLSHKIHFPKLEKIEISLSDFEYVKNIYSVCEKLHRVEMGYEIDNDKDYVKFAEEMIELTNLNQRQYPLTIKSFNNFKRDTVNKIEQILQNS